MGLAFDLIESDPSFPTTRLAEENSMVKKPLIELRSDRINSSTKRAFPRPHKEDQLPVPFGDKRKKVKVIGGRKIESQT